MYPTKSPNYQAAVYAATRSVIGKVTFDISDVTAAGDVTTITTTAQASISDKQQLIDKKRDPSYNLATLEPNRFKLDGTFSFADDTAANNGEMGFCSSALCSADGTFSAYPTITFQFGSTHSSMGLTVTFDRINNEYATDYTITAYDAAGAVITSVDVTGNTDVLSTPIGQLYNYKSVSVVIKKWSKGYRRARVLEVDFGVVRVYTDDNLISMELTEEVDLTGSNLTSPEFKFTVDNSSREFNILNPTGFYKYLQQRQQVIPELGVRLPNGLYEMIPLGNYLLWEWKSESGSLTTTFTARTPLDVMANYNYTQTTPVTKTLYQLAVDLFTMCGVKSYSIDPGLQAITTNSMAQNVTCKTALQMIAIAACANIYVTRGVDSAITIKCMPSTIGATVDTLEMDNMYAEAEISLDKVTRQVVVSYWTDLNTSADVTVTSSAALGDTLKLTDNTFINTSDRATAVANWVMSQKANRAKYVASWRGNPAHELLDVVGIENSFGQTMKAYVTKMDLSYEGYLAGKTEARGTVN